MGRKKKPQIEVSAESKDYIKALIKEYPSIKEYCESMEATRPMMLKRSGINPAIFHRDAAPSWEQIVDPKESECSSYSLLMDYLEKKERVYLLEHGINSLNGLPYEVAVALFLERKSWEKVMAELCISRMTVDRARNEAIRYIASEADEYMHWKAQNLFGS